MSVSSIRPLNVVGSQLYSGGPRTGEFQSCRGGALAASIYSGGILAQSFYAPTAPTVLASGNQFLFLSGAGRLNSVMPINANQSGALITFYDAGALAPSGAAITGLKIIGVIPLVQQPYFVAGWQSGGGSPPFNWRYEFDAPFSSGLCVSAPSGAPGFIVNYTPEVIPTQPYDPS
jgi:hypothetical protein